VVLVDADAELRIGERRVELQRTFECFTDVVAVACGANALASQHLPLHERPVRSREIEPGFCIAWVAFRPRLRGGDGCLSAFIQEPVVGVIVRIDLNAPPDRGDAEHSACFRRGWRTGLGDLGVRAVELCGKNRTVCRRELRAARQRGFGGCRARDEENRDSDEPRITCWCEAAACRHVVRAPARSADRAAPGTRVHWLPTSSNTCRSS